MTGPDDLKRRSERLARELLEAMSRPGVSPEREAYEARKEQEDKAALEAFYRRTGQAKDRRPRARTLAELEFAASLEPCAHCGSLEPVRLDLAGSDERWTLVGACPRCGKTRAHTWLTEGDPREGVAPPGQLGDARPSQVIRPGQFLAELDRLGSGDWSGRSEDLARAITCLHELLKFVPAGGKLIPDTLLTGDELRDRGARRERYTRAWLRGELERLLALRDGEQA